MKKYYCTHCLNEARLACTLKSDCDVCNARQKLDDNAVLFDDEDPVHSLVFLNCITTVSTNTDDNTPIIRVKYIEKSYKAAAIFLIILAVICIGILALGAGSMNSAYILMLSFLFLLFLVSTAAVIYTGRVSGFLRFYPDHLDFYYGARRNYRWRSIKRHISAYIELISYQVQRGQNHYITLYKIHINGQRVAKDLQEYDARFLHAYLIFYFSGVTDALPSEDPQRSAFQNERVVEFS